MKKVRSGMTTTTFAYFKLFFMMIQITIVHMFGEEQSVYIECTTFSVKCMTSAVDEYQYVNKDNKNSSGNCKTIKI